MIQIPILVVEIFYEWGVDFMGLFPLSYGFVYILLAINYFSKWVEGKSTKTDDLKTVTRFIMFNIISRIGIPQAMIGNQGTHFCNQTIDALLKKHGVFHKIFTSYHP